MTAPARIEEMWPLGLNRLEAARWVGVGVTKFDEMVEDGRMPKPRRVDGRKVWDRRELTAAFDELPHDGEVMENPWLKKQAS